MQQVIIKFLLIPSKKIWYDEIRKISTGQGDVYTTGCSLDFSSFEKNCKLIAVDLSKPKGWNADSRAIQQFSFTGKIKAAADNTRVIIYYISEQSKETMLEFSKGITSFVTTYKWLNIVK